MAFQDQNLTCKDCGAEFVWTAGEQEFYQQKGFTTPPTRCRDCRAKKKAEMRNTRSSRQMFTTTCGNCGKEAQVPFEPRGDKPVYCADCFRSMRSQNNG